MDKTEQKYNVQYAWLPKKGVVGGVLDDPKRRVIL